MSLVSYTEKLWTYLVASFIHGNFYCVNAMDILHLSTASKKKNRYWPNQSCKGHSLAILIKAFFALLLPIILLGGIFMGALFTSHRSSNTFCLYNSLLMHYYMVAN